jgi:hypothetical protein
LSRPGHLIREKPYATRVFEKTDPIVIPRVRISEFRVNSPNGMKLTASMKFVQTHDSGIRLGGKRVPSWGVLSALMNIQ